MDLKKQDDDSLDYSFNSITGMPIDKVSYENKSYKERTGGLKVGFIPVGRNNGVNRPTLSYYDKRNS